MVRTGFDHRFAVIPDGEADPGSCAAHARGGPRSALRSGGDDIV
ncbi:hypothetical protein PbB2_01629 [Candidatus Phycosocius bacilliformis]|uniref:Uncharacterized protein n=1 Tax=Candidatus Phycosocius bacilliformis TaxID=1445552 RepID=A0A2P2EA70_9PROT|nr:hypothetical protein PbB2_01629 [Candidatus Phycosocius bacilliformis]